MKSVKVNNDVTKTSSSAAGFFYRTIKELENMVKVEGRGRLISTKTQMGSEV